MPITDEDVLRELLHRATDDVHAPSAVTAGIVTRHRRRLRSARILSITTTSVAAAAVVATVVVTHTGPSASGHARCKSQALRNGHTTSYRPCTITAGILRIRPTFASNLLSGVKRLLVK